MASWSLHGAVVLVAIAAFAAFDLIAEHPLYGKHVAPLVTPLYDQHIAPLVDKHVVPLVETWLPRPDNATSYGLAVPLDVPMDLSECRARAGSHLTDVMPIVGFHVVCLDKQPIKLVGAVFKEGMSTGEPSPFISALDMGSFRREIELKAEIPGPKDKIAVKYQQPWAYFTPDGSRLTKLSQFNASTPVVYVFEGGQFIWPGIRIGHKRVVRNLHGLGDVTMETLEMTPLVFSVEEFLRDDEIDVVLNLSLEHLAPSGVTLHDGDEGKPATEWRTSTTYWLSSSRHPLVQGIDQRVQDLVKVDKSHQEDVQVLRYEETQKYDHHTDYFPVESHQNNPALVERLHHGFKNRMITVFWYMSDVAKGGHTIFPRAGGKQEPASMKDCTVGLKVAPKKRKVIIFYSMFANGQGDKRSLHGGCPVEDGVKYSGNKWVWNKPRNED
ncbi:unnamed protein product [Aphanomyces euteiches]|uniref:Fe2OG dioxygenase domain-containing protein n=1 Tax=Aphanomyces euteiches TaxID=100861 RepID=A0A6G0X712_9STRA|nr:hypothetical protein Ae201684_007944 [Aphanomyces euteiches]KAH9145416.1 hypothetical protein AeRB84_010676 [Aphanomyces euteiches]